MMFYSNTLNLKNVNYKKHSINGFKGVDSNTDENLLSLKNSPLSYNFDYSNGSLKDGLGIGKLRFRYELNSPEFCILAEVNFIMCACMDIVVI